MRRGSVKSCAVALVVGMGTVIITALTPFDEPLIVYVLPAMAAAYLGGLPAGLVATATVSCGALLLFPSRWDPGPLRAKHVAELAALVIAGAFVSFVSDILRRERDRARANQLRVVQQEERFSRSFHASPAAQVIVELVSGNVVDVTAGFVELTGWSRGELLHHELSVCSREDQQNLLREVRRCGSVRDLELSLVRKDGERRITRASAIELDIEGKEHAVATLMDLSARKQLEETLQASVAEKEILLKEIHHRVKNNLQVISSLLKLNAEKITDPVAKAAFADSQDRVRSIALLHEKLYQSKNLGAVSAADYTRDLIQALMRTHGSVAPARTTIDAPGVFLPIDLAVPCGLILNELITNALKHAFPQPVQRPPEIRISMSIKGQDLLLELHDNGVGLPKGFELSRSQTLGMHLVRTLARQLKAEVSMTVEQGTLWAFRFPLQIGN